MRIPAVIAVLLLMAPLSLPQSRSFNGEIMDSQCAGMDSHDKMIKRVDAKTARDCTRKCVELGARYVLFDPASKTIYQLDNQSKPAAHAGEKVTVKGTLDAGSRTIHIESIEAM